MSAEGTQDHSDVAQLRRVDRVCDSFENLCRSGLPPRIEGFLAEAAEADRAALLRELLRLEVHYRQARGEKPTASEYAARFPEHAAIISDLFPMEAQTIDPTEQAAPPKSLPLPTIPSYEILCELGRGGMAVVYKARDLKLNRIVALKVILNAAHATRKQLDDFFREGETTARLSHPNIVHIQKIDETPDRLPYLDLEFIGGGTLAGKLAGNPQPPREAAELTAKLARAVAYAHSKEVIHRDLKPANVLLTETGELKIADFGLAKMTDSAGQTATGDVFGTPAYMAPEQARGDTRNIGPAADIYALGVILFEMLTGRVPFTADSTLALLRKVEREEPPSPRALARKIPRDLEAICLMCLEKNPADRYRSAHDLAEDLECYLTQKPLKHVRSLGPFGRLWKHCRRNPLIAGLSVLLCVAALVFALLPGDDSLRRVQRSGKLRIGIDPDAAPFAFEKDGKLEGLDVDLSTALAKRLGAEPERVEMAWNWPAMVERLERREFDVLISVITVTEERKRQVAFVEYANDPLVFTAKPGTKIQNRQDLAGKIIAVQAGTTAEQTAERLQRGGANFARIDSYPKTFQPFEAVREGKADLTLDHRLIALHARKGGNLDVLGPVGEALAPEPLGIAMRKEAHKLRAAIGEALAAMKADGEYGRILEKWQQDK